jgi:hypothetical protein
VSGNETEVKKMSTCNYKFTDGNQCKNKPHSASDKYCVMHSGNKSLELFYDSFNNYVKECENSSEQEYILFEGVIFPNDFRILNLPIKKMNFTNCLFKGEMIFDCYNYDTKFLPFFRCCTFREKLEFQRAKFNGDFNFYGCQCKKEVIFWWCWFWVSKITENVFYKNVDFVHCHFTALLEYCNNESYQNIEFRNCQSDLKILIENVKFVNEAKLLLNRFNLENSHGCILRKIRIENTSFFDTDLEKVDLEECTWPKIKKRAALSCDETQIIKELDDAAIENLLRNYRLLRRSFEKNLKIDLASDMYIREMEIIREQNSRRSKVSFIRFFRRHCFSAIALYRFISFYGENYTRPILLNLFFLIIFSFLYLFCGFSNFSGDAKYTNQKSTEILNYKANISDLIDKNFWQNWANHGLRIGISSVALQRDTKYQLRGFGTELYAIQSGISASLVALSLLALRRKFKR